MRRLGIHSVVCTGGQTRDGLEMAIEASAEPGYRAIALAYLRPELFDLDRPGQKARSPDVEIGVSRGPPPDKDVSSEDQAVVAKGRRMPLGAVTAVRDIGGTKLGGILYSAHASATRCPPSGAGGSAQWSWPRSPRRAMRRAWRW